jgi:hypothetical protein
MRREGSAGAIAILNDRPRKRAKGRLGPTLPAAVNPETQPVAIALIEAGGDRPRHALAHQPDAINKLPAAVLHRTFSGEI